MNEEEEEFSISGMFGVNDHIVVPIPVRRVLTELGESSVELLSFEQYTYTLVQVSMQSEIPTGHMQPRELSLPEVTPQTIVATLVAAYTLSGTRPSTPYIIDVRAFSITVCNKHIELRQRVPRGPDLSRQPPRPEC